MPFTDLYFSRVQPRLGFTNEMWVRPPGQDPALHIYITSNLVGPQRERAVLDPAERWPGLEDEEETIYPTAFAVFKEMMAYVVNGNNHMDWSIANNWYAEARGPLPVGQSRGSYIALMERLSAFME